MVWRRPVQVPARDSTVSSPGQRPSRPLALGLWALQPDRSRAMALRVPAAPRCGRWPTGVHPCSGLCPSRLPGRQCSPSSSHTLPWAAHLPSGGAEQEGRAGSAGGAGAQCRLAAWPLLAESGYARDGETTRPPAAFVITGGGPYCEPGPDTSLHACQRSPQGRALLLAGRAGAKGIPRAREFSETAAGWVRRSQDVSSSPASLRSWGRGGAGLGRQQRCGWAAPQPLPGHTCLCCGKAGPLSQGRFHLERGRGSFVFGAVSADL